MKNVIEMSDKPVCADERLPRFKEVLKKTLKCVREDRARYLARLPRWRAADDPELARFDQNLKRLAEALAREGGRRWRSPPGPSPEFEALRTKPSHEVLTLRPGKTIMNKRQRRDYYRRIHQSYCLKRLANGRYIALNRDYKPLGLETQEFVRYEDFPLDSLPGLTSEIAAALSARGSDDVDNIYLYNDGCVPTRSAANMRAYEKKLALLDQLIASLGPSTV